MAVCVVLVLGGCAKPPLNELEEAQRSVMRAGELGADNWSPGEYELATRALEVAEQQIADNQYRAAHRTLVLAQRYADSAREEAARSLALIAEQERLAEQRLAEQQLIEQERLAEQQRLAAERERKRQEHEKAAAAARAREAAQQIPEESPTPVKVDQYEVQPGQNLAIISQQPEVYGDTLLWPLIYRANRDQIKTPQEIFSGQILVIPRDKNREEIEAARQEAQELNLF